MSLQDKERVFICFCIAPHLPPLTAPSTGSMDAFLPDCMLMGVQSQVTLHLVVTHSVLALTHVLGHPEPAESIVVVDKSTLVDICIIVDSSLVVDSCAVCAC